MTTFNSTSGNDTFTGGGGNDTVTFSGNAAGYRVETVNGRVQVIDIDSSNGDTGTDTFSSIETLSFADRSYLLETAAPLSGSSETQINTTTAGPQDVSAITALADGGYVIIWQSHGAQDGSGAGIYAQRYDAAGNCIGSETQINTFTSSNQELPAIAALADGGYVITWESNGQDGSGTGIYAQRFNADGSPLADETRINTFTSNSQTNPAITGLADGGYVITWTSSGQDGSSSGVYAQRFDAAGARIGAETQINTVTSNFQGDPAITALVDGGYVIAWTSNGQDGSNDGIYAKRFDADGIGTGEVQINTFTTSAQTIPAITTLADGGYVITWTSSGQDGSSTGIYAQRFDAAGVRVGSETQINSLTPNIQDAVAITALADGGYVIAWHSVNQHDLSFGISAQRFDADGNSVGNETKVSTTTTGFQVFPAITALTDGGYVITWSSDSQDGSDYGIYAQRFNAAGQPVGTTTAISGTAANDTLNAGAGSQMLTGLAGNDTLSAGADNDLLIGGLGDDIYVLGDNDSIVELSNEGTDTVKASLNYTLGANLENLTLTGSGTLNGTGNALDNVLTGNSGNNILNGLAGNDTLIGGAGDDRMLGGSGNDTYHLNNLGDSITEFSAQGTDTVLSFLSSYTLGSNLENATVRISGTANLAGNTLGNVLTGASGNNRLFGAQGNDTLIGGDGNDTLSGGMGSDTANYSKSASGYRIDSLSNGNYQVVDIDTANGNNGTDIITGIERLDFNGTTYTLSQVTTATVQGEHRINTTTADAQSSPSITALADGGYVITWVSNNQDGSETGIYAQRFNAAGNRVGSETQINTSTNNGQLAPDITALADGGYVITWESGNQDGSFLGIYAQRFDAVGARVGVETQINTFTSDNQDEPAVTALADGGYVITWSSTGQDGSVDGVYAQRFDAAGNRSGSETQINTFTTEFQFLPAITALADGGYLIQWTSSSQDGSLHGIYAQRFNAAGIRVGDETRINTLTTDSQTFPTATALSDGGYVITWASFGQDGSEDGIFAQRFNASGVAVGGETQINTFTADNQRNPTIAALDNGGYVIAWQSFGQDGSNSGIFAQRFNAAGTAVGAETRINSFTDSVQAVPDITALADGSYVITWHSNGQDGSNTGIFAQRFNANGTAWGPTTLKVTGTSANDVLNTGTGNQIIEGGGGNDTLDSGTGNDTLNGSSGSDTLTGGSGNDLFRFSTTLGSSNIDTITDYNLANDTIQLENAVFTKLTATGTLNAANFKANATGTAADANDFILYETDTGKLFYDADGSGAGVKIQFAVIGTSTHPALTASEFSIT